MKTIAIYNPSGGTAKTTSTLAFASILAEKGKKVLVVDLDYQESTTRILANEKDAPFEVRNLYPLLGDDTTVVHAIIQSSFNNIDLLTNNAELFGDNVEGYKNPHDLLLVTLKIVKDQNEYDYCLIDCSPKKLALINNIFTIIDELIVPTQAPLSSSEYWPTLLKEVEEIKEKYNPEFKLKGIFIVMDGASPTTELMKILIKDIVGDTLCETTVPHDFAVVNSSVENLPITVYDPENFVSVAYRKLADVLF